MRRNNKITMGLMTAGMLCLAGIPAFVYAVNHTEAASAAEMTTLSAQAETETEVIQDEIDENVSVGEVSRSLKALGVMESAKQEVNAVVAVMEELRAPYVGVAIAQVNNYVNVRAEASTESEVLGKLYDNSAATVLETTDNGWYKITSGSVTGYVKSEYVVVGDEELARKVSTRYATVTTTTLNVRKEPTTEAKILTMLPEGDDFVVVDESMYMDGWVLVTTSEGEGYVSTQYVELWTDFVKAESKAEEEARLKKEEEARKKAAAAAEAARKKKAAAAEKDKKNENTYTPSGNSNGQAVVDYACQFVGNPYVYGGTSLTNGADCSGFVMSVYAAFGISLPHSSKSLRSVGYEVSTSNMQPGDIVCYSGHVAIYVGNDTIVHASSPRDGIKYTSPAAYKSIICIRRIF